MTPYRLIESHVDGAATIGRYETLAEARAAADQRAKRYREGDGFLPCRLTVFGPPIDRVFYEVVVGARD